MAAEAPPIARPGTFGRKLHDLLNDRGLGARTLAKMIARQHGGSVEDRRRAIIRWLRGATPVETNRHIVEAVLDVPRDSLKGDEDEDEESSREEIIVSGDHIASVLIEALEMYRSRENVVA